MLTAFLKDFLRVERVMNAVAAGTSVQTSSAVDCQANEGYDEVTFMAAFGALTATQVTSIKVQESDDNSTYNDSKDTASINLADTDGNKVLLCTIRPTKRYLKCIVTRGTANAVIDGVWAFLRRSKKLPVTQSSAVAGWETHDTKGLGTA
jgi:hypothetical protein